MGESEYSQHSCDSFQLLISRNIPKLSLNLESISLNLTRMNLLKIIPGLTIPLTEISFKSSRSSGPGGQNVNKVESRIELTFDVRRSTFLTEAQRSQISGCLKNRIDKKGVLHLAAQKSRSQWENREIVLQEFMRLLKAAMRPRKTRIKSKPSQSVKETRLKEKRIVSEKKKSRSRFDPD